jgi:hypothetical protein
LNIITTNENAAKTEIRGIARVISSRLIFRSATHHPEPESAYSAAQVDGLRYPSGMCMRLLTRRAPQGAFHQPRTAN